MPRRTVRASGSRRCNEARLRQSRAREPRAEAEGYYHVDAPGSVQLVTDQSDQVLRHRDYLPFAEEYHAAGWVPENPPHDRKLFTGQERDFETGLDYFHARQLRVDLGRFTTPDPLTDLAWTDGTLGATSAYSYVVNNPLGFVDPDGRDAIFVNFSQGADISGHRFGHNGMAVVSADGSVLFSDFGQAGAHGFIGAPRVTTQPMQTHIEFDANGNPTLDSLAALGHELEAFEHAPADSVRLAYYSTNASQTTMLTNWITNSPGPRQNSWYSTFILTGRNCANYVREGFASIGIGSRVFTGDLAVPNIDWLIFGLFSNWSYIPSRAGVTTEWIWRFPDDKK